MPFETWILFIGGLLISVVLLGTTMHRLPLSSAMLYLAIGYGLGPAGLDLLAPDPVLYSSILERVSEAAVLISLFAVGLKLGLPMQDKGWYLPLRLATLSMTITVALIAAIGMFVFGLSPGAAILLGAILAPTDPVLASDVQVLEASDRDHLRFALTGEGGLNDGAAFPFVMLGLGLLGLHDLGEAGWRWLAVDVIWAVTAGLCIGSALGALIGRLVVYLRSHHQESLGYDEFLALGLIALAYGIALQVQALGFLAVFAAGMALQRVQDRPARHRPELIPAAGPHSRQTRESLATSYTFAGAFMMQEVRGFNEQMERIAEVAVVVVTGAMLSYISLSPRVAGFILLLLLVVRPLATWLGLLGAGVSRDQKMLISWFGIRGIGSIYYLMYAINHGLEASVAREIIAFTVGTVLVSIVLHGISVTPLMNLYMRRTRHGTASRPPPKG